MQSDQPEDRDQSEDLDYEGVQEFRIERGAQVLGTDGSLGTVQLIVVDQATGALQGLVVRGEAGMEMELPAAYLESATGDRVYLSIGRADLAAHPELAQVYRPELYQPVDEGAIVPPGQVRNLDAEGPVLTEMETDAVEIAAPPSREAQPDDLKASAASPDIADEPTVVLESGAQTGQSAAQLDRQRGQAPKQAPARGAESAPAGTTLTGTAAMEGITTAAAPGQVAPVDTAIPEAVPLGRDPTDAAPLETAPPAVTPAATGPLPDAASESLFPGTLPLTPADQAVADEARTAAQAAQSSAPTADAAPQPSAPRGPSQEPVGEPRIVPVLRPEQPGATVNAGRNVERQPSPAPVRGAGPSGDTLLVAERPPESGRALRRMGTAGVLAGAGLAAMAYLVWRWRQTSRRPIARAGVRARLRGALSTGSKPAGVLRRDLTSRLPELWLPVSLPDIRERLRDAGTGAGALAEALRRGLPSSFPGNVPVSPPDMGPRLRDVARAGAQVVRTPPDIAASVEAVRRRGLVRARALVRATDWANIWNAARDGLNDLGSTLRTRAPDVRLGAAMSRLRRRASQAMQATRSARGRMRHSTDTAREVVTGRAAKAAPKPAPRPTPKRALRRAGRRARWFRRGLIAGLAWGILYAPEAGDDTRNRLLGGWQRVQHMSGVTQNQQETRAPRAPGAASATGTGTGPRPRNPAWEEAALLGGEVPSPLMQPRSEEPLVPPSLPEAGSDEIPGAPSQI